MNREYTFRFWDALTQRFYYMHLTEMIGMGDRTISIPKGAVIQQYTGLKDKNGVEIFEGDIVTQIDGKFPEYTFTGVVYYDLPNSMYCISNKTTGKSTGLTTAEIYLVVNGNIFEK